MYQAYDFRPFSGLISDLIWDLLSGLILFLSGRTSFVTARPPDGEPTEPDLRIQRRK